MTEISPDLDCEGAQGGPRRIRGRHDTHSPLDPRPTRPLTHTHADTDLFLRRTRTTDAQGLGGSDPSRVSTEARPRGTERPSPAPIATCVAVEHPGVPPEAPWWPSTAGGTSLSHYSFSRTLWTLRFGGCVGVCGVGSPRPKVRPFSRFHEGRRKEEVGFRRGSGRTLATDPLCLSFVWNSDSIRSALGNKAKWGQTDPEPLRALHPESQNFLFSGPACPRPVRGICSFTPFHPCCPRNGPDPSLSRAGE